MDGSAVNLRPARAAANVRSRYPVCHWNSCGLRRARGSICTLITAGPSSACAALNAGASLLIGFVAAAALIRLMTARWMVSVAVAAMLATGAATAFKLAKTYAPGAYEFGREIAKPVAGTVRVAVDGVEKAEGPDFSVDATTGIVTFATALAAAAAVTAGFEFDVPVRFDTDVIEVNVAAFEAGEIPSIPAVEVRI